MKFDTKINPETGAYSFEELDEESGVPKKDKENEKNVWDKIGEFLKHSETTIPVYRKPMKGNGSKSRHISMFPSIDDMSFEIWTHNKDKYQSIKEVDFAAHYAGVKFLYLQECSGRNSNGMEAYVTLARDIEKFQEQYDSIIELYYKGVITEEDVTHSVTEDIEKRNIKIREHLRNIVTSAFNTQEEKTRVQARLRMRKFREKEKNASNVIELKKKESWSA